MEERKIAELDKLQPEVRAAAETASCISKSTNEITRKSEGWDGQRFKNDVVLLKHAEHLLHVIFLCSGYLSRLKMLQDMYLHAQ